MSGDNLELVKDAGCSSIVYLFEDGVKLYEAAQTWKVEKLDKESGSWLPLNEDDTPSEFFSPCIEECEKDAGVRLNFTDTDERTLVARNGEEAYSIETYVSLCGDPNGGSDLPFISDEFVSLPEAVDFARRHYDKQKEGE